MGVEELDDASCANAPLKSDRSLIQSQRASATPMQTDLLKEEAFVVRQEPEDTHAQQAGSLFRQLLDRDQVAEKEDIQNIGAAQIFAQAGSQALKERADWTGRTLDVEFAKSKDMKNVAFLTYSDYAGPNSTGNVSKTYMEMSFPMTDGGQIVADPDKDKILMFGFDKGTFGIKNAPANRIWSGNPKKKYSMLVYGIIMTGVTKGKRKWEYDIEFLQPPPASKFKIYPPGGKVGYKDGFLFLAMTCEEPPEESECDAGNFVISRVSFRNRGNRKKIKTPEEVLKVTTTKPR